MATKNNLFSNAKVVADDPKPRKKGEKEEVAIKDLDTYTAIDTMIKTLEGVKDVYRNPIITEMVDTFVKNTLATQSKPDNFKGIGQNSEASCELRKRTSKSPLSVTELAILKQYNVNTETVVLNPAREEKYSINPEIVGNAKLAQKVSDALSKIPELKGMDILFLEPAKEAETVEIVSDQSFIDAAKITSADSLKQIYEVIATPAVKPKMLTDDFQTVLNILGKAGIKLSTDKKSK